jgi:hypothetical protein
MADARKLSPRQKQRAIARARWFQRRSKGFRVTAKKRRAARS